MKCKIIDLLDGLVYIAASIGLLVAAFNGSMIWVCACGFLFIDESITMACIRIERRALMNADEIVMELREHLLCGTSLGMCKIVREEIVAEAADLIDSLQAQLSASQRGEKDAVEYLNYLAGGKKCPLCKNVGGCDIVGTYAARRFCKRFDWSGPQNSEKGENNA